MARCKWMMTHDDSRAAEYKELFKQDAFADGEHGRAMEGKCPLPDETEIKQFLVQIEETEGGSEHADS